MTRKYDVHTTKDFLVWALILAALGLWFLKDGWAPSAAVKERHPREVFIKSDTDGLVGEVLVRPGMAVATNQPVIRLLPYHTNEPGVITAQVRGDVLRVLVKKSDDVKRDQELAVVQPDDSFYTFNKSLSILFLLGAATCAVIHKAIR